MQNLEGLMVETGRVIQRRYLLQRLVKQGQVCAVYQGFDQVLQRVVAVKVAPAEQIPTYRASLRLTSQFSHPNIIGVYDVIPEADGLYIVQEYVDGDDFATLLQAQPSIYQIADLGRQICQALMYANTSSRKVCHGDLTPATILRDRRGSVRLSNFASPPDMAYFNAWSIVGADGVALLDAETPWGQMSENRLADDTRAVGILLYQLLSGRPQGATSVEPPTDGRLRFHRNVPPEVCDVIARTLIRQHPQNIVTPDALYSELKAIADALEPYEPVSTFKSEDVLKPHQVLPTGTGKLSSASAGVRQERSQPGLLSNYRSEPGSLAVSDAPPAAAALADPQFAQSPMTDQALPYPEAQQAPSRVNMPVLIVAGLLLFALFFVIGYFLAQMVLK
ncbi:protein kinase domain-containing protein [Ktedonobacter robiniae]|uniref:non-specific serine/threonine protein kinase n=1 Tax=Ktedonobacter robiniae TaxID=2778365 RepID=A0ABQ3ULC7_9CHLR|nr:protein kinase [Ktedonobacter robiniae]GHO53202.1 hypothetical protein KSB_16770 [Ktedonobacter robiniae]